MLEIRKDRAEKRPEDKELAKEICDIVKLPFNEKEFIKIKEYKNDYVNYYLFLRDI